MSTFTQAVSWIIHSEDPDDIRSRFKLDDQQMQDAEAVAAMFQDIYGAADDQDFDLYNAVHKWSKK